MGDKAGKTSVLSVLGLLESLTLAILLALVFRGFVVEAIAIPTGSMAQTLLGAHTETICEKCRYTYSSSVPTEQNGRYRQRMLNSSRMRCPNCGDTSLTLRSPGLLRAATYRTPDQATQW